MTLLHRILRSFGPSVARPSAQEIMRASVGAGIGLVAIGTIARLIQPASGTNLWLIAPLGATAFLAFAVPNSPLAQPWSAIVGNTVSALIGIAVVLTVPHPLLATALAVALAFAAMMALRAMHPPGGAVALGVTLSAPMIRDVGFAYALSPVLLDTALLIGAAILYNRATGRIYPFRQAPDIGTHGTTDPAPDRRLGLNAADLGAILERLNLSANIGAEDLTRVIAAAEADAAARHFNGLTCADMMSRDLITIRPDTPLRVVAETFRQHRFKTLPVTDASGTYLGLVNEADLLGQIAHPDSTTTAADVMKAVETTHPEAPIARLLALLTDGRQQAVPVVEGAKLTGLFTRTDLISALAHALRGPV